LSRIIHYNEIALRARYANDGDLKGSVDNMAKSEKLAEFRQALAAARKLQQDWITYGVECVDLCVEDVDGDWWETWGAGKEAGNGRLRCAHATRTPIAPEPS